MGTYVLCTVPHSLLIATSTSIIVYKRNFLHLHVLLHHTFLKAVGAPAALPKFGLHMCMGVPELGTEMIFLGLQGLVV